MSGVKRKALEKRLERIMTLNGGELAAEKVVADAKDAKSPLHAYFDWDDSIAGHQWRLHQARELIRSVKIEVVHNERTVSTVRYVRDPRKASDEQGYCDIATLRTDKDVAREALSRELNTAEGVMVRASSIALALGMASEFDDLLARVRGLRERTNLSDVA
jgi:hypothetical protein